MNVYQFPGPDVREAARLGILGYAEGQITRQRLNDALAGLMRSYRVTQLPVDNCILRLVEKTVTPVGEFETVLILGRGGSHKQCPVCKSKVFGYLAGEDPAVTVSCLDCGCIYERVVRDEKAEIGT